MRDDTDDTDDGDRGELRELLLDSVPGLDEGQRAAMFQHTFEAPVDDEHAADDLVPDDAVFDSDDWSFSSDEADVADAAVDDVTEPEPEHAFADEPDIGDALHETHESPDELSDMHEFGLDHGAGPDQHVDVDPPDLDGDWT